VNDLIIKLNLKESTQQYCLIETYLGHLKVLKKRTFSGPLKAVDALRLDCANNLSDVLLKKIKNFLRDESRQIKKELLQLIESAENDDQIKMGMFYLSDRDIITALKNAANSGVDVKLILDPNKDAFGMEKNGIPNRQVASEMTNNSTIEVRWYDTQGEQYHSKIILIKKENESIIIGGSANMTKRNIGNLNLETNVLIVADNNKEISIEVNNYFEKIWNNSDGVYTTDYSTYQDDSLMKKIVYRIQEWTGLSTF